jgi:hypothetical protein
MIFFSIFFVTVFFIPGILIYLIIRPRQTLEEAYQKTLEEELLLRAIEDVQVCPGCGHKTEKEWIACPYCELELKNTCNNCNKKIDPSWKLCPYCGADLPIAMNGNSKYSAEFSSPLERNRQGQQPTDQAYNQ